MNSDLNNVIHIYLNNYFCYLRKTYIEYSTKLQGAQSVLSTVNNQILKCQTARNAKKFVFKNVFFRKCERFPINVQKPYFINKITQTQMRKSLRY